jgi:hypothetical protein
MRRVLDGDVRHKGWGGSLSAPFPRRKSDRCIGKTAAHLREKSDPRHNLALYPLLPSQHKSHPRRSRRLQSTPSAHFPCQFPTSRQPLVASKAPPEPRPPACSSTTSKLSLSGLLRTSSTICHLPPLTSKADLERALFDFNADEPVDAETSQLPHSSLSVVLLLCGEESRRPRPHSSLVLEPFKPP